LQKSNCNDNQVCSTEGANVSPRCTCSEGTDTCQLLGTCISYCQTAEAKALLASMASSVTPCDTFLPNACSGGLVCQPSTTCRQATCSDADGLQLTKCSGVCAPAVRSITSASLTDDARGITAVLNAPARGISVSCSDVFATGTVTALGSGAWCSTDERTLSIKLGASPSVRPGDTLVLLSSQSQLVDKLLVAARFTGNITLESCLKCQRPTAVISGPQVRRGCSSQSLT
jgi:hypothetical protein